MTKMKIWFPLVDERKELFAITKSQTQKANCYAEIINGTINCSQRHQKTSSLLQKKMALLLNRIWITMRAVSSSQGQKKLKELKNEKNYFVSIVV